MTQDIHRQKGFALGTTRELHSNRPCETMPREGDQGGPDTMGKSEEQISHVRVRKQHQSKDSVTETKGTETGERKTRPLPMLTIQM